MILLASRVLLYANLFYLVFKYTVCFIGWRQKMSLFFQYFFRYDDCRSKEIGRRPKMSLLIEKSIKRMKILMEGVTEFVTPLFVDIIGFAGIILC